MSNADFIGEPVVDLSLSQDWCTLNSMVGLSSVKVKIKNMAEIQKTNLALELEGKPLRTVSLNRLFLGQCVHHNFTLHSEVR
jgi:hypothetical protein